MGAKDDEAARFAKLQSNRHHHQQANTQLFTGRMVPNQQCQSNLL